MIGLVDYCAFLPNRMCSEKHFGAFSAFILRFDCFARISQNQYTFNHESLHVVIFILLLKLHTATTTTVSPTIYCLTTSIQLYYSDTYS